MRPWGVTTQAHVPSASPSAAAVSGCNDSRGSGISARAAAKCRCSEWYMGMNRLPVMSTNGYSSAKSESPAGLSAGSR
jgi:hypothetical protein